MNIKMFKVAVAGLVLSISAFSNAGIIYSNGTVDLENNGAYFSDTDGSNYQLYDDFSLVGSSTISSIDFWGSFWSTGVFENDLSFSVNIYGDNSGVDTGNLIGTSTLNLFSQLDTGEDHNNNGTADIYRFSADLSNMINITDTATYWISVFATNGTNSSSFAWQEVSDNGNSTQYNGSTFSNSGTEASFDLFDKERSDEGVTTVPEPSTLAIFALGIMGLASRRFKKQ